jgi:predicted SnoaL-like aldol condensation-catalyzing enzyme
MSRDQTSANKAVVARLYEAFNAGDADALAEVLADDVINHNPWMTNGRLVSQAALRQIGTMQVDVHRMIAEGDLVAVHVLGRQSPGDRGIVSIDIFRVENGRLAEHWDVSQDIPETSANDNGMF